MDPVEVLERIASLLKETGAPRFRVDAFRTAATRLAAIDPETVRTLAAGGRLRDIDGVGQTTAEVVAEAVAGKTPAYLTKLEAQVDAAAAVPEPPLGAEARALRQALRGDCHTHSDWSDGRSPIDSMARAAAALGHDYVVLTDHSPRLRVANGLTPERLRQQLDVVAGLNEQLAPFRILTGIEVDILDDGSLDQEDDLLAILDVVVASVHSKLRMPAAAMTERMVTAVRNPHVDILGHCTGRRENVGAHGADGEPKHRPESEFDAAAVFAACAESGTAVEINCQPERRDPPRRLLRMAVAAGCSISIDTDAHGMRELQWQGRGCSRAVECGVAVESIVNTLDADGLVAWAESHNS